MPSNVDPRDVADAVTALLSDVHLRGMDDAGLESVAAGVVTDLYQDRDLMIQVLAALVVLAYPPLAHLCDERWAGDWSAMMAEMHDRIVGD